MVMTDRELYSRTTATAIDYYGCTDLARILNVNADDLQMWATGHRRPPTHVFLRIIDLANADETSRATLAGTANVL
jgi:hypothetical protein